MFHLAKSSGLFLLFLSAFLAPEVLAGVNRPDLAKFRTPLVLMYHDVVAAEKDIDATADVTEANMKSQLEWLVSEGYTSITIDDFYQSRKGLMTVPAKSFLVTVDDGYRSALLKILPMIEKLQVHAVFFVNTGMTGDVPTDRMTMSEVMELDVSQWATIYSHTVGHENLTKLSSSKLSAEFKNSRSSLETTFGDSRPFVAYPFGIMNDVVKKEAALHYDMAFSVFTPVEKPDHLFNIERFPVRSLLTNLDLFKNKLATWFDGTYQW